LKTIVLTASLVGQTVAHFSLQRRNERFGQGIVKSRTHPPHRGEDASILKALA
jgi:hypothetical protein